MTLTALRWRRMSLMQKLMKCALAALVFCFLAIASQGKARADCPPWTTEEMVEGTYHCDGDGNCTYEGYCVEPDGTIMGQGGGSVDYDGYAGQFYRIYGSYPDVDQLKFFIAYYAD